LSFNAQLKDFEKDAARKVTAANIDLQARTAVWESEKDGLKRALDQAQFMKEELTAKNAASEGRGVRVEAKSSASSFRLKKRDRQRTSKSKQRY
jgi:hypothetical protein